MNDFDKARIEIDRIDYKIVMLLIERFSLVNNIAILKKETGIEFYDSKREEEIIYNVNSLSDDDILKNKIENVYKELLVQSRKYQKEKEGEISCI